MTARSVRILWDSDEIAQVSITGDSAAWTVDGNAVTFPYNMSTSTTFVANANGRFDVSVKLFGTEIANTPDGTRAVQLKANDQITFAPTIDGAPSTNDFLGALTDMLVHRKNLDEFARKINAGEDAVAALAGASSGDEQGEWWYRTWETWGESHPECTVQYHGEPDETTGVFSTVTIQTGTGEREVRGCGDWFGRTAAELVGTDQPRGGPAWTGATGGWSIDGSAAVPAVPGAGYVVAPGYVYAPKKRVEGTVTIDASAGGAANKVLLLGLSTYTGTHRRIAIRITVNYTTGVASWQVDGEFPTFALLASGTGTPLAAGVQTVPWSLEVDQVTGEVTAILNGETVTATLTADQREFVNTMGSVYFNATTGDLTGWKVNEANVYSTVTATAPVVTIINASKAGTTFEWQQERIEPLLGQAKWGTIDALFGCSCSNYGTMEPAPYLEAVDSFLADYLTEQPDSGIVMVLQAPQAPPSATRAEHRARTVATYKYAADRGYGLIDTLAAFEEYADWPSRLMRTDGQHPTAASAYDDLTASADPNNGQYVWKEKAVAYLRDLAASLS